MRRPKWMLWNNVLDCSNPYSCKAGFFITHTVVMREEQEVYSVSCIGVLPFIEGSLGDCTKWSGSC